MFGVTNGSPPSAATCLALMQGSMTVFVNNGGVTRVGRDKTIDMGTVLGPGSLYVFCEDKAVSVAGDAITAHAPCPLPPVHCAAFTTGSTDVFTGGVFGPQLNQPGGGADPMPDLTSFIFFCTTPNLTTGGVPYAGPLIFSSEVLNAGAGTSPTCVAGLFQILPGAPIPPLLATLTRDSASTNEKVTLISEKVIGPINPGGVANQSWSIPAVVVPGLPNYYAVSYDIDNVVRENLEGNNSSTLVTITAT